MACGLTSCLWPSCGDGAIFGFEEGISGYCDDGNDIDNDGCSSDCQEECGYSCSGGSASEADLCITSCGDGVVAGAEECDDDNSGNLDGCSSSCVVEAGWNCTSTPCGPTTCSPICADGKRVGNEQCDTGAGVDGCSATCTVECGFTCNGGSPSAPDFCDSTCGDGVRVHTEACDDNNTNAGDGCSPACSVEAGWTCSMPLCALSTCQQPEVSQMCGDGQTTGTEALIPLFCDDSNNVSGDGCSGSCTIECGWACSGGSSESRDSCLTNCGDGRLAGVENCDDGNTVNNDGCSANCSSIEPGWNCTNTPCGQTTCLSLCGDGARVGDEECDDGNISPGDGCSDSCTIECGYTCLVAGSACQTICGDGLLAGLEMCDDGNTADGDGCSADCSIIEDGWGCANAACLASSCRSADGSEECGDSVRSGDRDICVHMKKVREQRGKRREGKQAWRRGS